MKTWGGRHWSSAYAVIIAITLLSAACSTTVTGPPEIVVDQTACSHCGMLVSEPVYAAAYQAHGKDARLFDDIGCMLEALRGETTAPIDVWLQDAGGAGWLDADVATVVASPRIRTPMSGGLLAYADDAAAVNAATAQGGHVMRSLQELITWKGDAR